MGKSKKENTGQKLTFSENIIQENITGNSTRIKMSPKNTEKKHKHTDNEIQSADNLNSSFNEDIPKKKKKKKHTRAEKEDGSDIADHINESIETDPNHMDSLQHDDKVKLKRKRAKKHRQEKTENKTDPTEIVHNKVEDNTSVENKDTTKNVNSEEIEKRKEERKQKKKEKKIKKEQGKVNESEKLTDTEIPVGPSSCQLALDYLTQWNNDKEHWKFQKVRQVWLLQNIYHGDKIENEHFKVLLLYLDGMKGKSREMTVKQAEVIIAAAEEGDEKALEVTEIKVHRARQIIQVLAQ